MRKRSSRKATATGKKTGKSAGSTAPEDDRRHNLALREVVNELVDHVRSISGKLGHLSSDELEYNQERLEWLADEIWRLTVERHAGGTE